MSLGAGVGGAVWLTNSGRAEEVGGLKECRVGSLPVDQMDLLKDQGLRALPKMDWRQAERERWSSHNLQNYLYIQSGVIWNMLSIWLIAIYTHTILFKSLGSESFFWFWEKSLILTKAGFIWSKIQNSNTVIFFSNSLQAKQSNTDVMRSQVCACRVFYNGIERSEKQYLIRIENFCNIIKCLYCHFWSIWCILAE